MDNDLRYVPVAAALPAQLPPLTRKAAYPYAQRLVKKFGKVGMGSPRQQQDASLMSWGIYETGRRCWASPKPTSSANHHRGWGRLIHDCSHIVFQARHPSFRPHDGGHAALEAEMAAYAKARGWLDLAPSNKVAKPTLVEVHRKRLLQYEANEKRWVAKQRRAVNALRKLKRQRTYSQRIVGPA